MSSSVFQRYSAYYDLLYGDKDYAREADYVARLLREANPGARTLLEFGSGTGRHGRLLAARGFDVVGVERSAEMVALAEEKASDLSERGSFRCQIGDFRSVDLGRKFDAAIALFHVVSYQTSDEQLASAFTTAARHLPRGGLFFFDVWHGPAVVNEKPSVRVKRVGNDAVRITRIAEPEHDESARVVTVNFTILAEGDGEPEVLREEHRMRYLFPDEIQRFAEESGFRMALSEEYLSGRPASDATWGVAYLLIRN